MVDKILIWAQVLLLALVLVVFVGTEAFAHEWKNPMLCVSSKSTFEDRIYMVCQEIPDEHTCYSDKAGCSKPIEIDGKLLCEIKCKEKK